ncbi:MAG TPA: hypothetical protein VHD63_15070, partial [Ktedonobacteraceae bacterium]|nr:hypothetical protein [Ktedonobacteraceae bacterium]
CLQAEQAEDGTRVKACRQRLAQWVLELPVRDADYCSLLIQQDRRFRDLQLACEQRIEALLAQLTASDDTYRQLRADVEAASDEWRHHAFRTPAYEAEMRESTTLYLTETALRGKKDYRVPHLCTECGEPLWQYVAKQPKTYHPYSVQEARPARRVVRSVEPVNAPGYELVQWVSARQVEPLPLPDARHSPPCVTATWRRRYALAKLINDRYPGFFGQLIADEMHEGADKTALSRAREALASACSRMLGLTGTLSNGYASSLFRLYYTLMASVRAEFSYHDTMRWVRLHGKMQTTTKSRYETPPAGKGSESKREISPGMPVTREIPGFNATGMGRVARVSSLTELSDVVENLVGYTEDIRLVKMGDTLRQAYQVFQGEITQKMRGLLREGDNSGLSPWYHALMTVGDLPWRRHVCATKHGVLLGVFEALPEETVWPIEAALIQYVQEQHLKGHRVLVYTEHTGEYDEQDRIKTLLERYVRGRGGRRLKVAILRSTSTKRSMDREAWLKRAEESGVDVLVCNPALVKVGLDLLAYTRIVYKSFPDKVTDFRQSSKRSRRPGQTQDVEVVVFTYEEALSLRLLLHMARKVLASLLTEGHIATEGLVAMGFDEEADEGDFSNQVAREMLAEMEAGTLGKTEDLATAIQAVSLDSARLEAEHHRQPGD